MIYDALKRLTKHSVIYALGPAAQKLIGFLLLPLVVLYVGRTENYGIVDLSAVTIALAAQCLGINLLHGMTRYYPEYATDRERGTLVTTCLLLLGATTGGAFLAALFFSASGAELLFDSREHAGAFVAVAGILFLQTIGQVGMRWLQILERSIAYGVLTTAKTVLEIGLKVWFLVGLGLSFMGVLYSVLGGELVVAAGVLVWIVRRLGLSFSWPMAKRLLRYSYPLILSGLLMFVLHSADRYFVKALRGLGDEGIYAAGYKLGTIGNAMFLDAFGLIWFPYIFGVKDLEAVRTLCRKVLTYFALVMTCASLAIAVFSRELTAVLFPPEYLEGHVVIPLVLAGYVAWAVYQVLSTVFYVREKTLAITWLVGGAAALNLALNAVLVSRMGYLGAAWATLATFIALAAASWIAAEKLMPVRYEIARVLGPLAFGVGLYLATLYIPGDAGIAGWFAKAAAATALPVVLWFGGFVRREEKDGIRRMFGELAAFARR
ncbi:MAG: lipopolysaccharide biosynthesis protein [Planctomycetota bacterium]